MRFCVLLLCLTSVLCAQAQRKLLVISVDGLDARYLTDADRLGLRIPHLRKLKATGAAAAGVVGIVPTVTWPSHTTLITGVGADEHGIVSNDQPGKPGQRWWFTSFLKARTLWQSAAEKKLKTAAVYWPVTVGDGIDLNFPEFWEERKGHEILFAPIASKATAGLEERVARVYPSFPRSQWSDTSAMQAVRYILEFENPDLTLVHIADLDSEAHDYGAFKKQSKAVLEHADYLIGWVLEKLPPSTLVAIVSDHGFENAERVVRPKVMLRDAGVTGTTQVSQGLIGTRDPAVAMFFRSRAGKGEIAREVPMDEVRRMAPSLGEWIAAFETSAGHRAINDEAGPSVSPGDGRGDHGLWPTRAAYRASFVLWGPGVRQAQLGEISMLEIAPTFAEILGVALPAAKAKSLWPRLAR